MSSPGVGKLQPGETNFQQKESRLGLKAKDHLTRSEPAVSFCRKLISRSRVQKRERGYAHLDRIKLHLKAIKTSTDFNWNKRKPLIQLTDFQTFQVNKKLK